MKPRGKWIQGIDGSTPLAHAVRTIMELRLEPVAALLPLAQARHEEDPEYIHQLRVASRRADAALKAFRFSFGRKRWRKVRKRLRTIRQAAGAARTCDVHIMTLAERLRQAEGEPRDTLAYALTRTETERRQAQGAVDEAARRFPEDKLRKGHDKLLASVRAITRAKLRDDEASSPHGSGTPTLLDTAMALLPPTIADVDTAAAADLSVFENLHQLRIESKRLRYSMEIFAPCFDDHFRKVLYPEMKTLQDHLGSINDAHEMALRFDRFACSTDGGQPDDEWQHRREGLDRLAGEWRAERESLRETFLQWWAAFQARRILEEVEQYVRPTASSVGDSA